MVTVALAITSTVAGASSDNPPLIQVDNIPHIPRASNLFRFTAYGPWKTYGNDCNGYIQRNPDLTQNGLRISVANPNITPGMQLRISFSFVCE